MARVTIHEHEVLQLPAVCIRCGEPATSWLRKEFEGLPLWMLLFFPVAIVLLAMSARKWTLDMPVCDRDHDPWRPLGRFRRILTRVFFGGLATLMGLPIVFGFTRTAGKEHESLVLFGFLAVSWLVAVFGLMAALCAFAFLSIRVRWLSPAAITLIHVHPRFVDALERQRRGESPLDVDGENNVPDLPHLKPDERIRR